MRYLHQEAIQKLSNEHQPEPRAIFWLALFLERKECKLRYLMRILL